MGEPFMAPASFGQERMWLLEQLGNGSGLVTPLAFRIRGPVEVDVLARSLDTVAGRHENLRTTFDFNDGELRQLIHQDHNLNLEMVDLRNRPETEQVAWAQERARSEASRNYDLERGPLLHLALARAADEESVLFLSASHLIIDAWSRAIFLDELSACYEALLEGKQTPLPDPPIQYADFATWQRENHDPAGEKESVASWLERWGRFGATVDLPTDRPRPALRSQPGAAYRSRVGSDIREQLSVLGKSEEATLFMVLMAAFQVMLARYTGQERFFVGVPAGGRDNIQLEPLIGLFMNMLVLPVDLSGRPTFRELVRRVRVNFLSAFAHRDVPLNRLVEGLGLERDVNRDPLFQVMFQMRNTPAEQLRLPGCHVEPLPLERYVARMELTLEVDPRAGSGLDLLLEYNTDLFEAATAGRMTGHFRNLLNAAAAGADRPAHQLPMLGPDERRQILVGWNVTEKDYPSRSSVVAMFGTQAAATPGAPAFIQGEESLSYGEVNERANRLAHILMERGAGPGVVAGLMMERSLEAMVGFLAILKCGAIYLPLDPDYPRERLAFMIEDARAAIILVSTATGPEGEQVIGGGRGDSPEMIVVDDNLATGGDAANPGLITLPSQPMYLIYTSGSTGRPKGAIVPQRQVLNRLHWMWTEYPFEVGEVGCLKTALNFVDSLWEMLGYALQGVPTVILSDETIRDPERLIAALGRYGVTRLWLVPTLLRALLEVAPDLGVRLPRLKYWIASGETLPAELGARFKKAFPGATLFNLYGTSEIWDATWFDPLREESRGPSIPIGRPIANVDVYILDSHLAPVPVGAVGELFVGGQGLAHGYLGRAGLTADRFVPHPFTEKAGARLYKSGDLARWLPDGNVDFVGRADFQVKTRGYRVEPGEVEAALVAHPSVRRAAVTAIYDDRDEPRLAAYVQFEDGLRESRAALRSFLGETLPDFMIPAYFVELETLPRTPSGKVDRRRLPALDMASQLAPDPGREDPDRPLENYLARIWAEVLGLPTVGREDDFFELGGHSLSAMSLVARIESLTGVKVPLNTIFLAPTVNRLAEEIRHNRFNVGARSLVPIRPDGVGPPLYYVHGLFGRVFFFYDLIHHLPQDIPVYGLQFYQPTPDDPLHESIEEMAAHYVNEIVEHRPEGPYLMCGFSLGGMIAYEMARQMVEQGRPVGMVGMFDTAISRVPGFKHSPLSFPGRLALAAYRIRRGLVDSANRARSSWRTRIVRGEAPDYEADSGMNGEGSAWREGLIPEGVSRPPAAFEHFAHAGYRAAGKYVPGRYPGRVTLFRALERQQELFDQQSYGWRYLASEVDVRPVPGNHVTMLKNPHSFQLARNLTESIRVALADDGRRPTTDDQ